MAGGFSIRERKKSLMEKLEKIIINPTENIQC